MKFESILLLSVLVDARLNRPSCPSTLTPSQKATANAKTNTAKVAAAKALVRTKSFVASFATTQTPKFAANIDTVFHVIMDSAGNGYVSDSTIKKQVSVLNRAYYPVGMYFNPPKINRVTNSSWYTVKHLDPLEFEMKAALRQGGPATLNVFIAGLGQDAFGWATFPWDYAGAPLKDGIVINNKVLPGTTDPDFAPFNLGQTLTHETGHWAGLYHIFEGGCSAENDLVADTPAAASAHQSCSVPIDSCPEMAGMDSLKNFMDYLDDICMSEFTAGQITRMSEQMTLFRLNATAL